MKVTYYGHSCFGVQVAGKHLLFDPFITGNALAKDIDVNSIRADYILVSHGHDDHVGDTIAIAKRTNAVVISAYEVGEWFGTKGITRRHTMNHGGAVKLDFGRVKLVNAVHSSVLPDGTYGGNPAGFVVETAEGNFYYSGDTALTFDMKLIGEQTQLKFAALCIGDYFTMGIEDAIRAAEFIQCKEVLGVHYNTFPPIKLDPAAAQTKFANAGKRLHLLMPGESHQF